MTHGTIDAYIADFPRNIRRLLKTLRATIKRAAPGAREAIKYRIPAFTLNGHLILFAAYKSHIGVYPVTPALKKAFRKDLAPYLASKATLRFPIGKPLPLALVRRIVKFRVKENLAGNQR